MAVPKDALYGWTIVIVDDEQDSLEVATLLLQMYGGTVITANNGKEALKVIREHRPHFIISDLSMPGMSGWELINILKSEERDIAQIPVIALTAHAMNHERRLAIEAGFHNFITKPLQPEKFVNQVISLLAVDFPELQPYS